MYALTSKDQLSRRQNRWVQDITDGTCKSLQSTDALPRSSDLPRSAIINPIKSDSKILEKLDSLTKIVETLTLTKKVDLNNFIPFFCIEDHVGKENYTKLFNNHLQMSVDILGFPFGSPIIYPFGLETNLPKYKSLNVVVLKVKETNKILIGNFKRNKDGIYIIQLSKINQDLPITLISSFDLIPE
jgi:hypothetical protein